MKWLPFLTSALWPSHIIITELGSTLLISRLSSTSIKLQIMVTLHVHSRNLLKVLDTVRHKCIDLNPTQSKVIKTTTALYLATFITLFHFLSVAILLCNTPAKLIMLATNLFSTSHGAWSPNEVH